MRVRLDAEDSVRELRRPDLRAFHVFDFDSRHRIFSLLVFESG